jgi:hypothetical protein
MANHTERKTAKQPYVRPRVEEVLLAVEETFTADRCKDQPGNNDLKGGTPHCVPGTLCYTFAVS